MNEPLFNMPSGDVTMTVYSMIVKVVRNRLGHALKIYKQIQTNFILGNAKRKMNNKIIALILNKDQFNQKLDRHLQAYVFSLHFSSKFTNKILRIELSTFMHLYH